jgi:DNA processing protein
MNDQETRAWLALSRIPHLSPRVLGRLIQATTTVEDIFQLGAFELVAAKVTAEAQRALHDGVDQSLLEQDFETVQTQQISLLPISSSLYPALLKEINDPPPLLYIRGDPSVLNLPSLAMVGSRRTSQAGRENALRFARELAKAGFSVVSGMALGVDTECHRGALAAGPTVAVLGTGVDVVYPRRNGELYESICCQGAVISEFPIGTNPHPGRFPRRNRIISGMSLGVVVVEAALQSGSLITARCAMEQGREVFAIPGSIHNSGSQGCHQLIKQGAKLVESVPDIIEELEGWCAAPLRIPDHIEAVTTLTETLNQRDSLLLDMIGYDPVSIDILQQRTHWAMPDLMASVTALELRGLLDCVAGNYQRTV